MAKSRKLSEALDRLAAAEERFLASEFLAPVVVGGRAQVRIAGVVCSLMIHPADFAGWGVFRPVSHAEAKLVRHAKLAERQRYLELFPQVRLILVGQQDDQWFAVPAHRGDARFRIEGPVPVELVEDAQAFEVIETRFDGARFWFAGLDPRWDPAAARYLREVLGEPTPPDQLARPGLTAEERTAYAMAYSMSEDARRHREGERLRGALAHAGAELKDFVERQDVYTVTYTVDGRRHVSAVSKRDLSVQVAGICLSGEDANFDLHSLVGVIREAQGGHIVRVGQENHGMAEEDYWRVHPPR
jgi:hypothetical protein